MEISFLPRKKMVKKQRVTVPVDIGSDATLDFSDVPDAPMPVKKRKPKIPTLKLEKPIKKAPKMNINKEVKKKLKTPLVKPKPQAVKKLTPSQEWNAQREKFQKDVESTLRAELDKAENRNARVHDAYVATIEEMLAKQKRAEDVQQIDSQAILDEIIQQVPTLDSPEPSVNETSTVNEKPRVNELYEKILSQPKLSVLPTSLPVNQAIRRGFF